MDLVDKIGPLIGLLTEVFPGFVGGVVFIAGAVTGLGGTLGMKLGGLVILEVAVGRLNWT